MCILHDYRLRPGHRIRHAVLAFVADGLKKHHMHTRTLVKSIILFIIFTSVKSTYSSFIIFRHAEVTDAMKCEGEVTLDKRMACYT